MIEYIPIPNPVTGLLRLLDAFSQMTFQDYLFVFGVLMGIIGGITVLWGLLSMIYLATRPTHARPKRVSGQGATVQTADPTDGGAR